MCLNSAAAAAAAAAATFAAAALPASSASATTLCSRNAADCLLGDPVADADLVGDELNVFSGVAGFAAVLAHVGVVAGALPSSIDTPLSPTSPGLSDAFEADSRALDAAAAFLSFTTSAALGTRESEALSEAVAHPCCSLGVLDLDLVAWLAPALLAALARLALPTPKRCDATAAAAAAATAAAEAVVAALTDCIAHRCFLHAPARSALE